MSEAEPGPVEAKNTDTHLWPQVSDDYYAPRIFATAAGGIGIDVGGRVIVKPLREWHALANHKPIETCLEVWNGARKVTVYEDVILRVWGTDIDREMSEDKRTHETVDAAFRWLYGADELTKIASASNSGSSHHTTSTET